MWGLGHVPTGWCSSGTLSFKKQWLLRGRWPVRWVRMAAVGRAAGKHEVGGRGRGGGWAGWGCFSSGDWGAGCFEKEPPQGCRLWARARPRDPHREHHDPQERKLDPALSCEGGWLGAFVRAGLQASLLERGPPSGGALRVSPAGIGLSAHAATHTSALHGCESKRPAPESVLGSLGNR